MQDRSWALRCSWPTGCRSLPAVMPLIGFVAASLRRSTRCRLASTRYSARVAEPHTVNPPFLDLGGENRTDRRWRKACVAEASISQDRRHVVVPVVCVRPATAGWGTNPRRSGIGPVAQSCFSVNLRISRPQRHRRLSTGLAWLGLALGLAWLGLEFRHFSGIILLTDNCILSEDWDGLPRLDLRVEETNRWKTGSDPHPRPHRRCWGTASRSTSRSIPPPRASSPSPRSGRTARPRWSTGPATPPPRSGGLTRSPGIAPSCSGTTSSAST